MTTARCAWCGHYMIRIGPLLWVDRGGTHRSLLCPPCEGDLARSISNTDATQILGREPLEDQPMPRYPEPPPPPELIPPDGQAMALASRAVAVAAAPPLEPEPEPPADYEDIPLW